jgi:hypothetical protein
MYVIADDRWRLRERLNRLGGLDPGAWQLRLAPRQRESIPVRISTSTARDQAGEVTGLRWTLQELPSAGDPADEQGEEPAPAATAAGSPSLLAELVTSRPTGQPTLTAVPISPPVWDNLAAALHRVVRTAVPLLRADGAGLMWPNSTAPCMWSPAATRPSRPSNGPSVTWAKVPASTP